jgi:hypothetical protein
LSLAFGLDANTRRGGREWDRGAASTRDAAYAVLACRAHRGGQRPPARPCLDTGGLDSAQLQIKLQNDECTVGHQEAGPSAGVTQSETAERSYLLYRLVVAPLSGPGCLWSSRPRHHMPLAGSRPRGDETRRDAAHVHVLCTRHVVGVTCAARDHCATVRGAATVCKYSLHSDPPAVPTACAPASVRGWTLDGAAGLRCTHIVSMIVSRIVDDSSVYSQESTVHSLSLRTRGTLDSGHSRREVHGTGS